MFFLRYGLLDALAHGLVAILGDAVNETAGVGHLEQPLHRRARVDHAHARVAISHLAKNAKCGGVEEGHSLRSTSGLPVEDGEPGLDPAHGGEIAFASNGCPSDSDVQLEPIADR